MALRMLETSEEMGPSVQVLHLDDESTAGQGAQGESSLHLVLTA